MSYRDEIVKAMDMLGQQPDVLFCGYNCLYGRAGGSLSNVPEDRLTEWPLAENLMLGGAIGVALDGFVPVVWVERADFLFCGADAIVNHINYLRTLSDGLHSPGVIIRVCVGNKSAPLYTGPTHTQNPCEAFKKLVSFNVHELLYSETIFTHYKLALEAARNGFSTMLFERKDFYGNE